MIQMPPGDSRVVAVAPPKNGWTRLDIRLECITLEEQTWLHMTLRNSQGLFHRIWPHCSCCRHCHLLKTCACCPTSTPKNPSSSATRSNLNRYCASTRRLSQIGPVGSSTESIGKSVMKILPATCSKAPRCTHLTCFNGVNVKRIMTLRKEMKRDSTPKERERERESVRVRK